jgi:hypothetical protein
MPVVYTGAIKLRGAQIAEIGLEQLADKSIADGVVALNTDSKHGVVKQKLLTM